MTSYLTFLLVFMIIAALAAVTMEDLLSAVISLGALGFAASIVFLMLKAPDVEIVKRIVEVLVLVLLVRATIRRDVETVSGTRDTFGMIAAAVLILLMSVFVIKVVGSLPEVGDSAMARNADAPSNHYLDKSLEETGAGNAVTGVLLDYRGYDTLGEATVLFAAVLGAVTLLRKRARRLPAGRAES